MRRLLLVLTAVVAVMVPMMVASAIPAATAAASPTDSLIYIPVPHQAGGTYSCAQGPPFVSDLDSSEANCNHEQSGAPDGFVCDIPTTITFVPAVPVVPSLTEYDVGGLLCH